MTITTEEAPEFVSTGGAQVAKVEMEVVDQFDREVGLGDEESNVGVSASVVRAFSC